MTVTLTLPDWIWTQLAKLARLRVETGGMLLAQVYRTAGGDLRLLGRRFVEVPEEAYVLRESASLLIRSTGYVPALAEAERLGAVPIWLHTHPGDGASPEPSQHDRRVDEQLSDLFRLRSGSEYYGAMIVSRRGTGLRFTGHLESCETSTRIDRVFFAGERLRLVWNAEEAHGELPDLFDRNVRALGRDVQHILQDLRIAVIGCGGTGSSVAEQLVRLGARHLTLVDPDTLSESNLTRVYGSRQSDIGRPKVEVVRDSIQRIAPDAHVTPLRSMLTVEATARSVAGVDLVFGCTDDNAGRLVLSRMATFMMIPVIDCGVLLTSRSGTLDGVHGRVTFLCPGGACLVCRQRVDMARASSELLTPTERVRLQNEGYAAELPGVEPSVVTYTTMVAAAAVGELLERLVGYGPTPVPNEVLLRMHEREMSTNLQRPNARHYCHPESDKIGAGASSPFLEQTWGA